MVDEWDVSCVDSGYAPRKLWICESKCYAPIQYDGQAKQTHPYLIYTAFTHWWEFLASLRFIEYIPACIELYLANEGGMGDNLSHIPYVSGNFSAFAPPKVSNSNSGNLGWLGSP